MAQRVIPGYPPTFQRRIILLTAYKTRGQPEHASREMDIGFSIDLFEIPLMEEERYLLSRG